MSKTFEEALQYRRAIRTYDAEKPIDSNVVKKCLEQSTLAPSSSNMQLYEFYHVTSKEINKKLAEYCFDQSAAKTAQEMVVIVVRKDLWKQRAKANTAFLKSIFGEKPAEQYSKREKFALNYYGKLIPLTYGDFHGILGYLKYVIYWMIGLFRPIYREARSNDIRVVAHKSAALAAQTFMIGMAVEGYDTCPMEGIDSLRIKKLFNLPSGAEINMVISCGIRKPEGVTGPRFRIPFKEVYKQW
ncbi:MAG: nitroreductase family protein [Bacteroidetes bacterium]|jgi:nitroreductase|nr:nitroreductase family protein [Bacteroidota bacterium]